MVREEILSKSREEKNDEFENKILKDAQTVGSILIIVICVFLLIANAVISDMKGLEYGIVSFDYCAIMSGYLSGIFFYSFSKSKSPHNIIAGILFALAFVCMLILYFINI